MEVLSIGFPLPNSAVDNYSVFTAPSFFDYDALVVDPESITRVARELIEDGKAFNAHDGRPVVNGASTAASVSAADMIQRRRDETQRLLETGGTVIVLGRPNATYSGVIGFEGCDRYSWLPAPEGAAWSPPLLRAAEGKTVRIRDDAHPLADILREHRKFVAYRAVFDDRQSAIREGARTIAVGGGDMPVAVQFDVLAGRVIFLPVIQITTQSTRGTLAQQMVAAIRRLHGTPAETATPAWTRLLALPGLEQLEAEVEEAQGALKATQNRLDESRERLDALRTYRALLWAEGHQFEQAVRETLQLLGFTVGTTAGQPTTASADDETLFVEFESSKETVVEWPYIRLQRRLEEQLLKRGSQPHGLVVVNGHRGEAPDQRKKQYTDALKNACETYRYGLVTSETLFAMAQRALGGADHEELEAMRRRLLRSRGVLEKEVALGEATEPESGGTIF